MTRRRKKRRRKRSERRGERVLYEQGLGERGGGLMREGDKSGVSVRGIWERVHGEGGGT